MILAASLSLTPGSILSSAAVALLMSTVSIFGAAAVLRASGVAAFGGAGDELEAAQRKTEVFRTQRGQFGEERSPQRCRGFFARLPVACAGQHRGFDSVALRGPIAEHRQQFVHTFASQR